MAVCDLQSFYRILKCSLKTLKKDGDMLKLRDKIIGIPELKKGLEVAA